ncbi:MAG: DUF1565 domain-containing protein [Desulfobacteraceae bacterium]|nr:MAG: DUF1565 domain-containing protein [Desulfobacteraceae bacterium]
MSSGSLQTTRNPLILICILLLLCTVFNPANAADYYVDIVNGCDVAGGACAVAGDGSQAAPWKTFHHAVLQLAAGDTLHALPGTYNYANGEPDTAINVSVSAAIIGEPFGQAVIDGSGAASWSNGIGVSGITGVSVQGLMIKNFIHGIDVNNCSPEILNNILVDNSVGISVIANMSEASPTIINNLIYEEVSNAMTYGIQIQGVSSGALNASQIYHNTIDGGSTDAIYFDTDVELFKLDVRYNNITGFGGYAINHVDPSLNAGSVVAYNNVYGNGNTYTTNLTSYLSDNIAADPGYADPANGDYHLPPGVGSVDQIPAAAGDPVTQDLDGKTRMTPFDIGCYEFADMYTLTVSITGDGKVSSEILDINCPGDCAETTMMGTVFRLTSTADSGYRFDRWIVDGTAQTDNPVDISLSGDRQVEAIFVALNLPEHTSDEQIFPAGTTSVIIQANNFFTPSLTEHALSHWLVRREDRKTYHNMDYDASFTADTDSSSGLTSHVVKGLTTGMVYVWKVGYENSDGTIIWSDEFGFAVGDNAPLPSMTLPGGTLVEDYRMLSFPIWTLQPLPELLDIPCDPKTIRAGTWDPAIPGYIECGPDLKVDPGRAYWVLSRNDLQITTAGIPVTIGLDVEVELIRGWNMISCPNARDYTWEDVQILESDLQGGLLFGPIRIGNLTDSTYIEPELWRWENGRYAADTVRMIPYNGYWVKSNRDHLFLKFPETAVSAGDFSSASRVMEETTSRKQFDMDTMEAPPMPMGNDSLDSGGGCFIDIIYLRPAH